MGDIGADGKGGEYEKAVRDADYYGFASRGYANSEYHQALFVGANLDVHAVSRGDDIVAYLEEAAAQDIPMGEYDLRVLRAVAQNIETTHNYSYDLAVDGTEAEQAILHGLDIVNTLPTTDETAMALGRARERG